jgi:hypothetical protein
MTGPQPGLKPARRCLNTKSAPNNGKPKNLNPEEIPMSNINIENLSYDMNMDRDAMDAIAGGWGFSSWIKKAVSYVKRNPATVYQYAKKVYNYFWG